MKGLGNNNSTAPGLSHMVLPSSLSFPSPDLLFSTTTTTNHIYSCGIYFVRRHDTPPGCDSRYGCDGEEDRLRYVLCNCTTRSFPNSGLATWRNPSLLYVSVQRNLNILLLLRGSRSPDSFSHRCCTACLLCRVVLGNHTMGIYSIKNSNPDQA